MAKDTDGNCAISVKGSKMLIEIDLSKNLGVSKSGKSQIVASTYGAVTKDGGKVGDVKVNLNVYK